MRDFSGNQRGRYRSAVLPLLLVALVFIALYLAFVLPQSGLDKARQLSARGDLTYQISGCDIKADNQKKYYLPGQPGYEQVNMTAIIGARWFCTEEDAVKNGWTKANP
jgi:hypothetical protein